MRVQASADGHLQGTPLFAVLTERVFFCPIHSIRMTVQVDTTNGLKLTQTGGNVVCGNGADKTCLDVCALPARPPVCLPAEAYLCTHACPKAHTRVQSQSLTPTLKCTLPPSFTDSLSHSHSLAQVAVKGTTLSVTSSVSFSSILNWSSYGVHPHKCTPNSREQVVRSQPCARAHPHPVVHRLGNHISGRRYPVRVRHRPPNVLERVLP